MRSAKPPQFDAPTRVGRGVLTVGFLFVLLSLVLPTALHAQTITLVQVASNCSAAGSSVTIFYNSQCTGSGTPYFGCTGAGTGSGAYKHSRQWRLLGSFPELLQRFWNIGKSAEWLYAACVCQRWDNQRFGERLLESG